MVSSSSTLILTTTTQRNTSQKAASIRYIRAVRRLKVVMSQVPGFAGDDRKEPKA